MSPDENDLLDSVDDRASGRAFRARFRWFRRSTAFA
jgi:hypothetical protein